MCAKPVQCMDDDADGGDGDDDGRMLMANETAHGQKDRRKEEQKIRRRK